MDLLDSDRLPCIHVSDLLKPCQRYVIYSKIMPPEFKSSTTEDMKSMIFGQMIHKQIKLDKENNEIPLLYNWVKDKVLEDWFTDDKNWHEGNLWDHLSGTIDDLIYVKGEPIIVDKKTTGSIGYFKKFGKPSDNHKEQTNFYRVLLKKCLNIDAKWGANLYISNCVTPEDKGRDEPVIIPYKLNDMEKTEPIMMEKCKQIKEYMTKKIIPGPTYNYMCNGFCNYAQRCFSETKTKFEQ